VDRRIKNPVFGGKKGDSPGFMAYVKRGKKIPKDYQFLRISIDRKKTVAQAWIRLGSEHRKKPNKIVDLLTVNLKSIHGGPDLNLSLHALPGKEELFAMVNGKRIMNEIKKKPAKAASLNKIDWKKWQFVGVALKYRVYRNRFIQCFHLVSSRITGDVYRGNSGFHCKSFPQYKTNYMSATFLSRKIKAKTSSVSGFIYGGNLATDILHVHYYSEGNVFLNFEMNIDYNQYKVTNYARKFDDANNAYFVYENKKNLTFEKIIDNEKVNGVPYILIASRPRTSLPNFGPLQNSFYINGVMSIRDNKRK